MPVLIQSDPGVEVNVGKIAIEPVWVRALTARRADRAVPAGRRGSLRRLGGAAPSRAFRGDRRLVSGTSGLYERADDQELLTRPDIKVFLPPIGGMTVYIFGPEKFLSDPSKELTCRMHGSSLSSRLG